MHDVFISYAHLDNQHNPEITHEVTSVIDHFLDVYYYARGVSAEEYDANLFFLDRTSIRDGDPIPERVSRTIEACSVMLAFYSPRYFRSYHCFQEYREFKRAQGAEFEDAKDAVEGSDTSRIPKLLIPIEVWPVDPEKIEHIDEITPKWISELTGAHGLEHSVTSDILRDRDTTKLTLVLRAMDKLIQSHIFLRHGSSGRRLHVEGPRLARTPELPDIDSAPKPAYTRHSRASSGEAWMVEERILSISWETAHALRRRGVDPDVPDLIRLDRTDGSWAVPTFQLDEHGVPISVVLLVNQVLGAREDPWGVADWWLSTNVWLREPPSALLGRIPDSMLVAAAVAAVEG